MASGGGRSWQRSQLNEGKGCQFKYRMLYVLIIYFSVWSSVKSDASVPSGQGDSPCVVYKEAQEDVVDCRSRGLTDVPTQGIPHTAVKLYLDDNAIDTLSDNCFAQVPNLKVLTITANNLGHVEACAFCGLKHLELLDLKNNQLKLSDPMWENKPFKSLAQLKTLFLSDNNNDGYEGEFHPNLLSGLQALSSLSLDTFYGNLTFGELFLNMTALDNLVLKGGVTVIQNNTFRSMQALRLKSLSVTDVMYLHTTELDAFKYLDELQSLDIQRTFQGVEETLRSLYPFRNRTMNKVYFRNINKSQFVRGATRCSDGVLDAFKVEFLSQICVENFALINSEIFVVESRTVTKPLWQRCLKAFDMTQNPFMGDRLTLWQFQQFKALKVFKLAKRKLASFNSQSSNNIDTSIPPSCGRLNANTLHSVGGNGRGSSEILNCVQVSDDSTESTNLTAHTALELKESWHSTDDENLEEFPWNDKFSNTANKATVRVRIPKSLEIINLASFSTSMGSLSQNINVSGGDSMREIYVSDNNLREFTGAFIGLRNLKIFDISYNDCSVLSSTFFHFLVSLSFLNMRGTKLDSSFMSRNSRHLFVPLRDLIFLDLSDNNLSLLSRNTFITNTQLKTLNLSKNRFTFFPFKISLLSSLTHLDLSFNSISKLSSDEMQQIDEHTKSAGQFSLALTGNIMVCGCSSIQYLVWIQNTNTNLDNAMNYTCLADDGTLTTLGKNSDIKKLRRRCNGSFFLMLSLILLCVMILGFVTTIMCMKLKTRLKAFIYRVVLRSFTMDTPDDYRFGVYISYADADTRLACFTLRDFIQGQLDLSTYVRDINLLPASDLAESIVEAVNSSWRVIFIITADYLDTELWSYFTMKTAAYMVGPANPGLIVVLVEEEIRHRLPACLLRVVDEDRIISLPRAQILGHEHRYRLSRVLLPDYQYS